MSAQNQELVWWKHLLAGGIGGATAKTVTAPIDRVKIFSQVRAKDDSLFVLVKKLYVEGGLRSFWRGNAVSVIKIIPESSTKFLFYDLVKRGIHQNGPSEGITVGERFIAGSVAGVISQTITYPLDVVKTNLALRRKAKPLKMDAVITRYYNKYGLRWFYKGYLTNLVGAVLLSCIDLPLYEILKMKFVEGLPESQKPPVYILLGSALCSSIVSQIVTYPIAMITTCIQATHGLTAMCSTKKLVFTIIQEKVKSKGILGLYDGLLPAMMKAGPATCVSFVVYEKVLSFLGAEMS